jgi:predicted alpha-1,2-mannosidase
MISPAETVIAIPKDAYVGDVTAAEYELNTDAGRRQPLLVQAEQLSGMPELSVELDGKRIFKTRVERDSYTFEVPMPAVMQKTVSEYRILVEGKEARKGKIERAPQPIQHPASYVDTRIGSAHSRWMIAPGPWMPFSMVKMSPDNQNGGWQSGYQPTFESLGHMSHVHCWTLAGVGMLPVNGQLKTVIGDQWDPESGYRSRIDKRSEQAPIGLYKVHLTDYNIGLEATTTSRCAFQRYTFPKDRGNGRVMIDMRVQAEFDYDIRDFEIRKVSDHAIEGFSHQFSHNIYYDDSDQEYVIHFIIEFDRPIVDYGGWIESQQQKGGVIRGEGKLREAGAWVEFDVRQANVVQARSGISYVSNKNARLNLETEISKPFGWDFDAVRKAHVDTWNETLSRVDITTVNRDEKIKFYNSFYRSIASRSTYSDVNGEWVSADTRLRQLEDLDDHAMGCDAFWNSFWNLNQVWNLITPEWSKRWVGSHLAMYDANGWMTNGPGAMKYIRVMVAEHEIPLLVSAHQMGIKGLNTDKMLEAIKKMENESPRRHAHGFVGNRDMVPFLKYHYVPWDEGTFSNTLEYCFDNWCVGQLAKAKGEMEDYEIYNDRGYWWSNVINPANGYAHMRDAKGVWLKDFDPFASGAHTEYVEGNAWQLTFFVPQDVPALVNNIGRKEFIDRLEWGFEASEPWRYNAPNDQYWDFPVVQGNQQSMHFSYLFNWAGKPWLTQKWTRSIADRFYGIGVANAYLGDEDQGQMSGWLVMSGIGLFQTDGGARFNPIYEIGSPIYEKIVIDLGKRYGRGDKFTIIAKNASRKNIYVQSAKLNGKDLKKFYFPASEVLNGGILELQMGDKPNTKWGVVTDFKDLE